MTIENVIDLLGAIGAIATPIILVWLSALGWTFKRRFEISYEREIEREKHIKELEEKLREDRIATYNAILEPFILVLSKNAILPNLPEYKNKTPEQIGLQKMLSLEYKRMAFKLTLIGSDEVIRAYNILLQYTYNHSADQNPADSRELLKLLGILLVEIRKSMGNIRTQLNHVEMLEWLIKDINILK